MSKKSRNFRPPNNSPKKKGPKDADDFLEEALSLEESGDRWRNQDHPKVSRFYVRAISAYESVLRLRPHSLDAAYNKARLQLSMATNGDYLPPGVQANQMLGDALASHLYCLNLPGGGSDHDIVFNTGQTFVSLAEELLSSGGDPEGSQRAVEYLTKAMGYFGHAMVLQTEQLELIGSLDTEMDTEEDGRVGPLDSGEMDITGEGDAKNIHVEQWVVIKEPVTKVELVDTITAQLETLTVFCGVVQSTLDSSQFTYIKERGKELIVKLEALLEDVPQCKAEASLPQANFNVSLADLEFKLGIISAPEYTKLVQEAFPSAPAEQLGPVMLVNSAEAYIQLAQALSDHTHRTSVDVPLPEVLSYLTLAAKFLAEAAKEDKTNARLFCLRGDVEMWRSRNIFSNEGYQNRMAAVETLWGNAGVYYRGAKKLAEAYPNGQQDIRLEGAVKEIIIGIQQNLSRGDGGFSEIVARAKTDLEQLPGWNAVAIDATRHGIFDEIILVELGK